MRIYILFFLIIIPAVNAMTIPALANTWREVTVCKNLKGHSYYLPGGLVPKKEAGWTKDGIKGGTTTLMSSGKEVDIVYRDVTGVSRSVRFHDKAQIYLDSRAMIQVYVFNKTSKFKVSEQYTFKLDDRGYGELVYTQHKDALISKVSMFVAQCEPPSLFHKSE